MTMDEVKETHTSPRRLDSALASLVTAARMAGLPADYEQMRRAYIFSLATAAVQVFTGAALDVRVQFCGGYMPYVGRKIPDEHLYIPACPL